MIRNRCNMFWADGGIHTKKRRENLCIMRFAHDAVFPPFLEWITPSTQKILQWFLNLWFEIDYFYKLCIVDVKKQF